MFCLRLPVGPGSVGRGPARVPELIRTARRPTQQLSKPFSPEPAAQPPAAEPWTSAGGPAMSTDDHGSSMIHLNIAEEGAANEHGGWWWFGGLFWWWEQMCGSWWYWNERRHVHVDPNRLDSLSFCS